MTTARAWLGFIVVFVTMCVLEAVVHMGLLTDDYQATAQLWRPMGEMKIFIFYIVYFVVAFFFTLVFSRCYEGRGPMEGLRYGLYMGLMMATPKAYIAYAVAPIPYSLALKWFISGLTEYIVLGIVLALIFGRTAMASKKR